MSAGSLTHDIDELTPFGNVTVTISASTIIGEGPSSTATLTTSQAGGHIVISYTVFGKFISILSCSNFRFSFPGVLELIN